MKTIEEHRTILTAQINELRESISNQATIEYLIDELALERHFKERYEKLALKK